MNFLSKSDLQSCTSNQNENKENKEKCKSEKSSDSNELIYLDQFDQISHPIFKIKYEKDSEKGKQEFEIEEDYNTINKNNYFAVKLHDGFTFIENFEFEKFTNGIVYSLDY
jgi:hypothetical protein